MPKVIIHGSAGASNGDASVWQIVSQARGEVDGDTALGACNEHLLTIFSFKIFVISVYSSATAVGVCLSRIYLGHSICFGYLKYDIIFCL